MHRLGGDYAGSICQTTVFSSEANAQASAGLHWLHKGPFLLVELIRRLVMVNYV